MAVFSRKLTCLGCSHNGHRQTHKDLLIHRHTHFLRSTNSKVQSRKVEGPPAGSEHQDFSATGGILAQDVKSCTQRAPGLIFPRGVARKRLHYEAVIKQVIKSWSGLRGKRWQEAMLKESSFLD